MRWNDRRSTRVIVSTLAGPQTGRGRPTPQASRGASTATQPGRRRAFVDDRELRE